MNGPRINEALLDAVRRAQESAVVDALRLGADPNSARDAQGCTPLHYAAALNMPDETRAAIIEKLSVYGADPNAGDNDGFTALHEAARYGRLATAQALLELGADVNARMENGTTPLHTAVSAALGNGETATLGFLIDHGADPLAANTAGLSPLDVARNYADRSAHGAPVVLWLETRLGLRAPPEPVDDGSQAALAAANRAKLRARGPGFRL